ncbi:MAG TPA: DUF433 domain-containing protein [Duganella sp.]|nr:DUF433 domain-containing protein [Duganella sp.]
MKYESSLLDERVDKKHELLSDEPASWMDVMPHNYDDIEIDEDCPEYDPRHFTEPVHRFKGRVIQPRTSPTDPFDPEVLESMKAKTPLVQMEPDILGGMPVFKNTLVPIKRMFDYLLAGKPMDDFLRDFPTVSQETATGVLENQLTLFYEEISNAIDSAAIPSSLPK